MVAEVDLATRNPVIRQTRIIELFQYTERVKIRQVRSMYIKKLIYYGTKPRHCTRIELFECVKRRIIFHFPSNQN